HAPKRPPFQVSDLDFFVENDPTSRLTQADTQLDILDAGVSVAGIKPSHIQEQCAADRAAAAPKRRCFLTAMLVDEMVEEVLVLGKDVERPGLGIIGAKDPVDRPVSGKRV